MTIKELNEHLSKYDENTTILFWSLEDVLYDYGFIDDDSLQNYNMATIALKQK